MLQRFQPHDRETDGSRGLRFHVTTMINRRASAGAAAKARTLLRTIPRLRRRVGSFARNLTARDTANYSGDA
jgi:hypothetical protein